MLAAVATVLMTVTTAPTAGAAASDPCPVTVEVGSGAPDSALVTVTAPPTDGCVPPQVVTWVNVLVDGVLRSTTQVRDRVGRIAVPARSGAEITVVARRTLGTAGGATMGYERVVVRLGPVLLSAPRPPEGLHVWGATDTALALGWSPPDDDSAAGTVTYTVTVDGRRFSVPETEAVITGLEPDRVYVVGVEAHTVAGSSSTAVVAARTEAEDEGSLSEEGPDPQARALTPRIGSGERNADGSADLDDDPTTVRQTLDGMWVRDDDVVSGEQAASVRLDVETSAGLAPTVSVAYESPSIADVDIDKETGRFTATLRRGARSGSVVITVTAPAVVVDGIAYEPLTISRRFVVEPPSLGSWPTAVNEQVTDMVT